MVRGVVDERELVLERVGPHVSPAAIEKRADDAIGPTSLDPPEPPEPGAAEHPREHGLGLVVLGVADRNAGGASFAGHLLKRSHTEARGRAPGERHPLARELHTRTE